MQNFIQTGDVLALTAPAAVKSGEGFLAGAIFAVAVRDAENGESVDARVAGVVELPKAADNIAQGALIYWDAAEGEATTTAAGNRRIGAATEPAGTGAAAVRVRLTQPAVEDPGE